MNFLILSSQIQDDFDTILCAIERKDLRKTFFYLFSDTAEKFRLEVASKISIHDIVMTLFLSGVTL